MSAIRLLPILALVALAAPVQADELKLDVAFEPPTARQTPLGELLLVPGGSLQAPPGSPLLPRRTFYFVLPRGQAPAGLRLEALVSRALPGSHDLAPAQRPVPLSLPVSPAPTPPDAAVYGRDGRIPAAWAALGDVQYKHGVALVPVTVAALAYRPLSKRVERLVSARLVLTTRPGGRASPLFRARAVDLAEVAKRAAVSGALSTYSRSPRRGPARLDPGTYEYLIIAPQAFLGLGGEASLEALADFRQAQGLSANLVALEWILANYPGDRPDGGQDDATRVREFLTDAYAEWGSRYVLLVGDADAGDAGGESGDDLMPVRKLYVDTGHPDAAPDVLPADLYYGCLDGTFDYDADGVYGEPGDGPDGGEVDLMAELYVGRLPADSPEEVQNFVAKTLAYEAGAGAWLKQVWMVGELLFNDPYEVWGGDAMDELVAGSEAGGFSTLGFASFPFFEPQTLYDRDLPAGESWSAADLVPLLDAGPHIVNHLGHSNVTYNMRLMNQNVDGLINVHPFLHYSQGCYNGAFDDRASPEEGSFVYRQDCIAEHLVTGAHGAFASISNSRYGWGSAMTDGPSQRFHRQFWDAFFAEGAATLGQALADSKEDNAAAFSDPFIRWVGYENNLLGDPAVVLKKSLNTSDPLLGVYPPRLTFVERVGAGAPAPQIFRVRNDGLDSLTFSVQADQSWLSVTPAAGDAPAEVEVQVDPTGLEPGLHQAVLTFESPEATNSPLEASVEFLLVEVPEVQVPHLARAPSPDGVIEPGEYDGALVLPLDEAQAGDVTLYLAVSGCQLFLGVDDRLDTEATDFDTLSVYFDRDQDGLWPTAPGADGAYWLMARNGGRALFLPVYNPGDGAQYDFRNRESNPQGFSGVIGFSDNHRVYEVALDLELSHIDVGPAGAFSMFVTVDNSDDMGAGTTTGWWPAVVPELDDQLYFGRLDLEPAEAWLDALPRSLRFEAVHEQSSPEPQGLTVVELLGQAVAFEASAAPDWLSVTPAAGSTPGDLLAAVDTGSLEIGSHQGEITVTAAGLGNSPFTIPVEVEILPRPARLELDPAGFELTVMQGDPDPVLSLTVANRGEQDMQVAATPSDAWLIADPNPLAVAAGEQQTLDLTVALAGLEVGSHQAQIQLAADGAEGSPQQVPVVLELLRFNSAPPVPELLSPAAGLELQAPVELTAGQVTDPEGDPVSYAFELLDGADQVIETGAGQVLGNFVIWQPAADLPPGEYGWRVAASDDRGATSGPSETRSFSLVAPETGCGCGQGSPGAGLSWLLAGLGLFFLGRRRS